MGATRQRIVEVRTVTLSAESRLPYIFSVLRGSVIVKENR